MKYIIAIVVIVLVLATGYAISKDKNMSQDTTEEKVILREEIPDGLSRAVFSTGCFWCIEPIMEQTEGVYKSISGYAGGESYNPTYEDVYSERTGHRESVMVIYDPAIISYQQLLDIFWMNIDPTDPGGQFFDRGMSYTTAIFYMNDQEKQLAESSKQDLDESGKFDKPIVTSILPFTTFYEAEEYHQDFYLKSSERYQNYSQASGRKAFKEKIWQEIQKEQSEE